MGNRLKNKIKRFGPIILLVFAIGAGLFVYAFFVEPNRLIVNQQEIGIKGWNEKFDGLKIVAISDIHGGSAFIDEQKIQDMVEMANAQNPDLIVLLGDFVSQKHEFLPMSERPLKMPMATIAENLKGLKAKLRVIAVLGNHDGWYNDEIVARELEAVGITVLQNEVVKINKNGADLAVLGLVDHRRISYGEAFRNELRTKISESKIDCDLLILEHSPDVFPEVTGTNSISANTRLFLAGHTHGGQVWLPLLGSLIVPSKYGDKYAFGHIKENGADMFVTTGVGMSILPVRFFVPPEIAVLKISAK